MSTIVIKANGVPVPTLQDIAVTETRWRFWRECGNVQRWFAVLLTMNIEPSNKNCELLQAHYPLLYKQMRDRENILIRRVSTYKAIEPVSNPREGKMQREKYVRLSGVLKLVKEDSWENTEAFVAGMSPRKVKSLDGSFVQIEGGSANSETSDLPKGERYTFVRYAALVHLLTLAISDQEKFNSVLTVYFPHRKASAASIGAAVASTIATFSKQANCPVPSGFGKDANAKEISQAEKVFKQYF